MRRNRSLEFLWRDILLVLNKYLIVTSDGFLLQNNALKRILSVGRYVLQLLWKKIQWAEMGNITTFW